MTRAAYRQPLTLLLLQMLLLHLPPPLLLPPVHLTLRMNAMERRVAFGIEVNAVNALQLVIEAISAKSVKGMIAPGM